MSLEVRVSLIQKKSTHEIVGFSCEAEPDADAEWFCETWPQRLKTEQSDVVIGPDGQMTLTNEGFPDLKISLGVDRGQQLKALLDDEKVPLKLFPDGLLCPGFRINPKNLKPNQIEKVVLCRKALNKKDCDIVSKSK